MAQAAVAPADLNACRAMGGYVARYHCRPGGVARWSMRLCHWQSRLCCYHQSKAQVKEPGCKHSEHGDRFSNLFQVINRILGRRSGGTHADYVPDESTYRSIAKKTSLLENIPRFFIRLVHTGLINEPDWCGDTSPILFRLSIR